MAYGTIMHMNLREAQPKRRHTTEPDAIHRIASSMIASSGPIEVKPEDFSKPQRIILKTMQALGLGGIALLIPNKDPVDTKP